MRLRSGSWQGFWVRRCLCVDPRAREFGAVGLEGLGCSGLRGFIGFRAYGV